MPIVKHSIDFFPGNDPDEKKTIVLFILVILLLAILVFSNGVKIKKHEADKENIRLDLRK